MPSSKKNINIQDDEIYPIEILPKIHIHSHYIFEVFNIPHITTLLYHIFTQQTYNELFYIMNIANMEIYNTGNQIIRNDILKMIYLIIDSFMTHDINKFSYISSLFTIYKNYNIKIQRSIFEKCNIVLEKRIKNITDLIKICIKNPRRIDYLYGGIKLIA